MKLLLLRIMMRVFSWITPPAAEIIAPPVAAVLWYLSPRKRRVTRLNLRAVYPDMNAARLKKIARDSMTHYVRGVFEAGMLWHWPLERIFSYFDVPEVIELYYEAERAGKGVILAAGHCGAWELLGLYLQQFQNGAILYKPGRHPDVEEMLLEKRRRGGATMVPASGSGLRTMFKLLRQRRPIAMIVDQEPTLGEGQFAPFYGIETLTGVLLPRMAQRTGAPVLFGTCERCKGGRYRVHVFKADEAIYNESMRAALTALNQGLEQCIEVNPAQNLWAYKRFRNRPEGEKSFYKSGSTAT
jgi:KDO2-lipid IV(A) lauroyltransferase